METNEAILAFLITVYVGVTTAFLNDIPSVEPNTLATVIPAIPTMQANRNTSDCQNTITTCSHYGHQMCAEKVYEAWAKSHCALYCGFCIPKIISPNFCDDKLQNCAEFDDGNLCTSETFYTWAYDNCRGYCKFGLCKEEICKDIDNNCSYLNTSIGICANVNQSRLVCQKYCNLCDIRDGNWSAWSQWGQCDVTCGNGTQQRIRNCDNPTPRNFGLYCEGPGTDTRTCGELCPVNGGWGHWLAWSSCSVSCGVGIQRRTRPCDSPQPQRHGDSCFGESVDYHVCFPRSCKDGGWAHWGTWRSCSVVCGGGIRSRQRNCTNPAPSTFGKQCVGNSLDTEACNSNRCPDNNTHQVVSLQHAVDSLKTYATTNVAFTVTDLVQGPTSSTISFRTILYNQGNGFSSGTGKFTSPYAGIYNFVVSLTKKRGSGIDLIHCYIRLNSSSKVKMYVDPNDDDNSDYGSYSVSASATFHLRRGDVIDLGQCTSATTFDSGTCVFTGILVRLDF